MSVPDKFITGNGPHLVEASAGTGKTTWMVKTAVRFLLNDPLLPTLGKPERLLAVTFTRAATAELKERLREQLNRVQLIFAGAECKEHEQWIPELRARSGEKAEAALQHALGSLDLETFQPRALFEGAPSAVPPEDLTELHVRIDTPARPEGAA